MAILYILTTNQYLFNTNIHHNLKPTMNLKSNINLNNHIPNPNIPISKHYNYHYPLYDWSTEP